MLLKSTMRMRPGRIIVGEPSVSLARSRVHRALSRPSHLKGADRELVVLTGLATVILIFAVLTWFSTLFGIAIWIVVIGALRMMAKADPMMRQVYLRHARYRTSYRPTSSPWRRYRSAMSHFANSAIPSRPSPIPSHTRAA